MGSDFNKSYQDNLDMLNTLLRVDKSYDMLVKHIKMSDKKATLYCVDGFTKDAVLEKMLEYFEKLEPKDFSEMSTAQEIVDKYVTYVEASVETSVDKFATFVLSGAVGMIIEGFSEAIVIDSRTYPARDVQEPESDKVLRGSHEGFVETIVFNTALIRRKIRDTNLTMQLYQVGEESKTDVVVSFVEGKADKKLLKLVTERISAIKVKNLAMSQESLKECMLPSQPLNPFPKVRYTERPDAAAACLNDGNILVICDGSPSVMIVPTGFFDFIQDINDYYFPPLVGTFLRYVRIMVFTLSMLLTPLWYLLVQHEGSLPEWLSFILIEEPNNVPIIVQLLIVEFVIDTLKLASLNTPSALSNSFSVVGALVLGEFAVSSGWFVSEVVLFMAFVAISNFTQPSYELGYALKLSRIFILILTAIFDVWGFFGGILAVIAEICFTKTVGGYTYLYPIIPFDKEALKSLLVRRKIRARFDRK